MIRIDTDKSRTQPGKAATHPEPARDVLDQVVIQAAVARIRARRAGRRLGDITPDMLIEDGRRS